MPGQGVVHNMTEDDPTTDSIPAEAPVEPSVADDASVKDRLATKDKPLIDD
jgi:hypothetical protein